MRFLDTDVIQNEAPLSAHSLAIVMYSRADQEPSSGSRCSTTYFLAGGIVLLDIAFGLFAQLILEREVKDKSATTASHVMLLVNYNLVYVHMI